MGGTQFPNDEIAHAIVLPPPAGSPGLARVLLMCRVDCGFAFSTESQAGAACRAFLWYPNNRAQGDRPATMVQLLPLPPVGYEGSADGFCSGHTVGPDGSVYVVGGQNWASKCADEPPCIAAEGQNLPVGHFRIYKLDTAADPPAWVSDEIWPASLERPHWYPTVIVLNDGTLLVVGHYGAPTPHCPVPAWVWGSAPETDRIYELFDPLTAAVAVWENSTLKSNGCFPSTPESLLGASIYPRVHLLSGGWVLDGNIESWEEAQISGPRGVIMDFEDPACGSERRWDDVFQNGPAVRRKGGSSVHLVVRTASTPTSFVKGVRDYVITFGGTDGEDDDPCPLVMSGPEQIFYSAEMLDPDPNGDGDPHDGVWTALQPMLQRRVDQNAVILPTGEIFVPGGLGGDPANPEACDAVLAAEAYFPAPIFGGSLADTWHPRALLHWSRAYHSVAFLLPDGRVVCGGGNGAGYGVDEAWHTLEIFEPEYSSRGQRPLITNTWDPRDPLLSLPYDAEWIVPLQVTLACESSNSVQRVILIRSGSPTHAFDMNQRYVELEPTVQPGSAYPNFTLAVHGPFDGYVAPPGYYLLFVIDANGLPSVGRWVRVGA